jgi:hypothetical protein
MPRDFRDEEPFRRKTTNYNLLARYGITVDQYNEMLARQNGVCAICEEPCSSGRRLAVDHDHDTGKVRGLLCNRCNRGIGLIKKSSHLKRAAKYLEKAEKK